MRLIGIDPGLRRTGWGILDVRGNRLSHVANGAVDSDAALPLAQRLVQLFEGLEEVLMRFQPNEAAVEETFVNVNPASTLKLGQARGIALLAPAKYGLSVAEYTPNLVKKSVVGSGHASKQQVQMMVRTLLPGCQLNSSDAADALAVAICHAHHRGAAAMARDALARDALARDAQPRDPQPRDPQARDPQARDPQARDPQPRDPQTEAGR